jgi:3-deoxy-D-manno-octulosonate 8-phosphate phosphatase (KDO 8-P phosphatase)
MDRVQIKDKLKQVKMLLLDVDGVLTDGKITYSDSGEQIKSFDSRDGFGIRLLMDSGIHVGIITGRSSKVLQHRCKNLGIELLFDGISNKAKVLSRIIEKTGIDAPRIAFAGDDLIDLPVMKKVGVAVSVFNASKEVKTHSDIVLSKKGGDGAVRELCEDILKAKGVWDNIVKRYLT